MQWLINAIVSAIMSFLLKAEVEEATKQARESKEESDIERAANEHIQKLENATTDQERKDATDDLARDLL